MQSPSRLSPLFFPCQAVFTCPLTSVNSGPLFLSALHLFLSLEVFIIRARQIADQEKLCQENFLLLERNFATAASG